MRGLDYISGYEGVRGCGLGALSVEMLAVGGSGEGFEGRELPDLGAIIAVCVLRTTFLHQVLNIKKD